MEDDIERDTELALDLLRRVPVDRMEASISSIIDIAPHITEDLLGQVDQPLKIAHDRYAKRDFLLCDYNRDGNSYRSPWTDRYFPKLSSGCKPSKMMRDLEVEFNEAFDIYRDLYYEGGVSSCYLWDIEDDVFGVCVLFKKIQDRTKRGEPMLGNWDSTHILEVYDITEEGAVYQLTSTVLITLKSVGVEEANVFLGGFFTRQDTREMKLSGEDHTHLTNIGSFIEDMEDKIRAEIYALYFGKTNDIVNLLRIRSGVSSRAEGLPGRGLLVGDLKSSLSFDSLSASSYGEDEEDGEYYDDEEYDEEAEYYDE